MKKLMFAAAAIAAGVAVADVTSANVVGYANDGFAVAGKWKTVCSQFLRIGSNDGADMTLKDLVPGGTWTHGEDTIKVFADTSAVKFNAVYIWRDKVAKRTLDKYPDIQDGWYKIVDDAIAYTQPVNSESLPLGTAVLAQASTTTAYITSSGEVVKTEDSKITFTFTSGKWRMIGNATPVALTLGNFIPNESWVHGEDTIKVFADTSAVKFNAVYIWRDKVAKRTLDKYPEIQDGWYKIVDDAIAYTQPANEEPIPAGAGILAQAGSSDATISIPTAL